MNIQGRKPCQYKGCQGRSHVAMQLLSKKILINYFKVMFKPELSYENATDDFKRD